MTQSPGTRLSRRQPRQAPPGSSDPRLIIWGIGGAVALVAVVWLLFLPPIGLLRDGDGWRDSGSDLVRRRSDVPKPPDGYVLASPFYEIKSKQDRGNGPAALTVPLGDGKGGRGLRLFTHEDGEWKPLGTAEVSEDGRSVRAEIDRVPPNVAAMRRDAPAFVVQAIVPPGTAPHPDSEKHVTTRSPFDFVPAPDGTLTGTASGGAPTDAVALIPVVRATAGAEAEAANAILGSEQVRGTHIAELIKLVRATRADGLDIEYTAVDPGLGSAYTGFVTALAEELHRTGQTLTVTVPIPRREGNNNWSTLGYDLKEIGKVADYVRIPPERDQSIYRRSVRDALTFITGQVDPKKVILTLTPMAVEKSETGLRPLTAQEALSVAAQFSVKDRDRLSAGVDSVVTADNLNREGAAPGLIWDATAAAVSFVYQSGDTLRTVWIENTFSAAFKLEMVQNKGLGGVAIDDAYEAVGMANIWPAIEQFQAGGQPALVQPNPGLLRPEWLIDGKRYEFGKAQFTWKAPEPGDHTISLIVSDGVMRVVGSQKMTVRQGAPPASPTASPGARTPTASPAARTATATTTPGR
jgi:hypothetical protein